MAGRILVIERSEREQFLVNAKSSGWPFWKIGELKDKRVGKREDAGD